MTYPQSGPGYGQGDSGQQYQQQYGQPQQYGQGAGYGQQQYGQQYGQQQYGAQAGGYGQQGQQYGQQQYGYQAPKPPSQGLPANTPTILAAVIGALGVITLFCGFVPGVGSAPTEIGDLGSVGGYSVKLFLTTFAIPWGMLAVAGVVAGTTFILGVEKWAVGVIASLSVVSAFITVFMFAVSDGLKAGAIILLITSILAAAASVLWLLIAGGQVQTAPAAATAPATAGAQAVDASAYGYGYGQPTAQQQPAAPAYGQSAQASYQADQSYGQAAAGHQAQSDSSPSNQASGAPEAGPTTAFQKPDMNK